MERVVLRQWRGCRRSRETSVAATVVASMRLAGVWVYSFFSFLLTGWLSCPISAAICGTGLALYRRRLASARP